MKTGRSYVFGAALALFLVTHPTLIAAQGLISSGLVGTMTVRHTNERIKAVLGFPSVALASKAIDLYKVRYNSLENGKSVVVTGLVALPRGGAPKGLVVFNHGTTQDRKLSPSRLTANETGAHASEAESAVLAFASGGYAVAMPDYLGLGDHKGGAHPYPLLTENSRSAIDLIAPAREIARSHNISIGSDLFVTGYSEGGGVAMALVRDLEQMSGPIYQLTGAAPLAGPYDLFETTGRYLMAPADQQGVITRLYLLSYMVNSFHKNRGVKLTNYFKPSMALTVSSAFAANTSDENVIKRLALAATLMRAKSLGDVLTPRFKQALGSLDTSDPVIAAMQQNCVYDWSPRTRMLLVNLEVDKVVDPANSDKALQTMRSRGVGPGTLRRYVIRDAKLNHITGVPTSLIQARRFFDNGFSGVREAQ
jgi:hypothetical protein